MEFLTPVAGAVFETTVFLDHFKDMPDHRQPGKVAYRLDEICCWRCCRSSAARRGSPTWLCSGARSSPSCSASCPSPTARRAMITWATSSPRSTPNSSVPKLHVELQSFRSMRRIEARRRKVSPLMLRFSQSLAKRRHRFNHAIERSTIHRLGNARKPLAASERLTISVSRFGKIDASAS